MPRSPPVSYKPSLIRVSNEASRSNSYADIPLFRNRIQPSAISRNLHVPNALQLSQPLFPLFQLPLPPFQFLLFLVEIFCTMSELLL